MALVMLAISKKYFELKFLSLVCACCENENISLDLTIFSNAVISTVFYAKRVIQQEYPQISQRKKLSRRVII